MGTILLKIIIVSSILIIFYYAFLEKEKILKFNRIFLLFSLVFSYTLPFIRIKIPMISEDSNSFVLSERLQTLFLTPKNLPVNNCNWEAIWLIIYASGSVFLLLRSVLSIFKILNLKGKKEFYKSQKIKILDRNCSPFSFLNTIYLGKNYFVDGKIEDRIFIHEKNHITQKHSLDLIFIECLKIILWFNPAIYFYKKAIITNHEFLSDEKVISHHFEISSYQNLILDEFTNPEKLYFTHPFNFNNTKKRFIMMTTKPSKIAGFKKLTSLSVFVFLLVFAIQKTYANNNSDAILNAIPKFQNKKLPIKNLEKVEPNIKTSSLKEIPLEETKDKNTDDDKILVKKIKDTVKPKMAENNVSSVEQEVDQKPEFPGGLNAFRSKLAMDFDSSVFPATKTNLSTVLYFTINKNGKIENITANGTNDVFNKEAVKALTNIGKTNVWKPATLKGKPVDYKMDLPLSLNFQ